MTTTKSYFDSYIFGLKSALDEIDFDTVDNIIQTLLIARQNDQQVFVIGNGGSAAAASHFACDLGKGTIRENDPHFKRFRALSLTDNVALMTAIGNDISYDDIFTEQLKNYLNPGDVVIAITASGNSPNVVKALEYANACDAMTIGLLGFGGGKSAKLADMSLVASSYNYGIAEDFHLIMNHVLTQIVRRLLSSQEERVVFLDRDGVINVKRENDYVKSWDEFEFVPGAVETLKTVYDMGYKLVVLTNQQGVGKGVMSETALNEIHQKMTAALHENGVRLEKIIHCAHLEKDGCECRKPGPGMFYRAHNELNFNFNLGESFFIGDSVSDVQAGNAVGCQTIFLGPPREFPTDGVPNAHVQKIDQVIKHLPKLHTNGKLQAGVSARLNGKTVRPKTRRVLNGLAPAAV